MSRVSTLSIVGALDLAAARSEYERFKGELSQPLRIPVTTAPDEARTSRTFGGQTVVSTAPPNPPGLLPVSSTSRITDSAAAGAEDRRRRSAERLARAEERQAEIEERRATRAVGRAAAEESDDGPTTTSRVGFRRRRQFGELGLGRLGQLFTAGYLLHEGLRTAEDVAQYQEQVGLAAGDPLKILQAKQSLMGGLSSIPFVGPAAELINRGVTSARGGQTVPVQIEMEQRRRVDIESATALEQATRGIKLDVSGTMRAAHTVGMGNQVAQAIQATRDAHEAMKAGMGEEYMQLLTRGRDLREEGRIKEAERVEQAGGAFLLTEKAREGADEELQASRRAAINREYTRTTLTRNLETRGRVEGFTGYYLKGAISGIDAQLRTDLDESGNPIGFDNLRFNQANLTPEQKADLASRQHQRDVMIGEAQVRDKQRLMASESAAKSAAFRLGRMPLAASLEDIEGARQAELLPIEKKSERDLINRRYDLAARVATQDFGDESQRIRTSLGGERSALESALRREPSAVGQVYTTGAAGINRTRTLLQGGRLDEGEASFQNTMLALKLQKQDYFDSFRGVAVDPRLIATQGGRQSEDPEAMSKAIKEQTEELKRAFRDTFLEAMTGG